jgi:hypothetical protein
MDARARRPQVLLIRRTVKEDLSAVNGVAASAVGRSRLEAAATMRWERGSPGRRDSGRDRVKARRVGPPSFDSTVG